MIDFTSHHDWLSLILRVKFLPSLIYLVSSGPRNWILSDILESTAIQLHLVLALEYSWFRNYIECELAIAGQYSRRRGSAWLSIRFHSAEAALWTLLLNLSKAKKKYWKKSAMLSQLFILSPRGDTIVFRDCILYLICYIVSSFQFLFCVWRVGSLVCWTVNHKLILQPGLCCIVSASGGCMVWYTNSISKYPSCSMLYLFCVMCCFVLAWIFV